MTPIKILIDGFAIEIGPRGLIFAPRTGGGSHLRLPSEPNPTLGRNLGMITPHVTLRSGRRFTLARITPARLQAFFERMGEETGRAWVAATVPVDLNLARMAEDGWETALPSDAEYASWAQRELCVKPGVYRWTERSSESLLELCMEYMVPVTALDQDSRRDRQPFVAFHVTPDDTLEQCWLSYYPNRGWCRTPYDWLKDDSYAEMLIRNSSPGFWRAMLKILDLLRIKGDREALQAALARVESLQRQAG